jgi:glycosyltransferase involved in cell wall biosynthesis
MGEVLFDATRLFIRGSRFAPTGIDRVVVSYARWLLSRSDLEVSPVVTVGGRLLSFPRGVLSGLTSGQPLYSRDQRSQPGEDASWRALVEALASDVRQPLRAKAAFEQWPLRARWHLDIAGRVLRQLRPARLRAGQIYLNVSHTGLDHPRLLGRLSDAGLRNLIMVHDLIPITYPEFCAPSAELRHVRRIQNIVAHSAAIIANSETTAAELRDYCHGAAYALPTVRVAPLGLQQVFLNASATPPAGRPYFICVGTLEARKNLTFLLAVWRRLSERMGPAAPHLVIVGRRGWENESVIDHLERSKAVARLVHEVSDLSDEHVACLMAGARALLGPSFAEGFDLPVVEAMSLGTPVIASDIPAHREFAPEATLLDALDGPAWLAAIERATTAPRQPAAYRAPTWAEHFADIEDLFQSGPLSASSRSLRATPATASRRPRGVA